MKEKSIITHKMFLHLMLPFILSAITQPILGATDIAVVGRLDDAKYISGVSIGALIFNTIYWVFGFLRVSTTAFSAQSSGCKEKEKISDIFFRPIFIALFISIIILLCQNIIFNGVMKFINPGEDIQNVTKIYFKILVHGAPFVLINYVMLGWLMGQGNIKGSLTMQMSSNVLNIILDILFVIIFKFKVEGVAYATLISQITSTCLGLYFILPYGYSKYLNLKNIFNKQEIIKILCVNRDLMVRTVCLLMHDNMFIAAGASFGSGILSANAVLFQTMEVMSYAFEGIANTSSVFSGRAIGTKDDELMKNTWIKTIQWGLIFSTVIGIIYFVFHRSIIRIFTDIPEILSVTDKYYFWIGIFPFIAFIGLTFYGVFTGAAVTIPVMTSTVGAFIGFFLSWKFIIPIYKNNGVWISLLTFYFLRSVLLIPNLRKLLSKK